MQAAARANTLRAKHCSCKACLDQQMHDSWIQRAFVSSSGVAAQLCGKCVVCSQTGKASCYPAECSVPSLS